MNRSRLIALLAALGALLLVGSAALAGQPADPVAAPEIAATHIEQVSRRLPATTGLGWPPTASGSGRSPTAFSSGRSPTEPALHSPSAGVVEWRTVFSDGFEGAFPGTTWLPGGAPNWAKTGYRKHAGNSSVYATGAGTGGAPPPGPYPNNANSWMVYGPFSLTGATAAEVSFYHWTVTEYTSNSKKDELCVLASEDGAEFDGLCYSGNWAIRPEAVNGWSAAAFDLAPLNMLGKPAVWIAFQFESDATVTAEGSYVDDVLLRISGGVTPTPTAIRTYLPLVVRR